MPRLERQYTDLSRPIRAFTFTVELKEEGTRLDSLLRAHYPWHSRTFYRRKVERGEVLVNGRGAKASSRVRPGDHVEIQLPDDPSAPERESADDLVILFEDEQMVAVDKPSGLSAHPVGRTRHGTLINKLHARYRNDDPKLDVVPRLSHRLDRDTSGVVLAVKNRRIDGLVGALFLKRQVSKTYLALVQGHPGEQTGVVDAPLGDKPDGDTNIEQAVRADGQPARSLWRVRKRFPRHTLMELQPLTGRTHQLRVHMAHLGHPIVCDHLYGDPRPLLASRGGADLDPAEDHVLLARLALHAHRLAFQHPDSGEPFVVESPLPPDLASALEALGTFPRAGEAQVCA
jgi:23S rRNA pseudouridine1911/1915/1917 synthase